MTGAIIQLRRNTSAEWASLGVILKPGEQGLETDTKRIRIGDGQTPFMELDYYLPSQAVVDMINSAIDQAGAGDGGLTFAALQEHIASLTPHSVYDDGPSLVLLYENAKV